MATLKTDISNNKKNLYCRDARANEIIRILGESPFKTGKGCNIRECPYGTDCKGAHRKEEIQYYPHILKWKNLNKSTFDFVKMYNEVLESINTDKHKMKGIQEIENSKNIKSKMETITELNFFSLVQLWHDLACFYRKLAKKIPKKVNNLTDSVHTSGYKYSEDVPKFYLSEEIEDYCWALVRITIVCNTHKVFRENYSKKQKVTIWDICLGDKNCKEGVHNINEELCTDDFLTGKCNCVSKEEYTKQKDYLENKLKTLQEKNTDSRNKSKIDIAYNNIVNYQRKLHYTDEGMIPFNIKLEEVKKQIEQTKIENTKLETEKVIGKVFKISLKKK